MVLNKQVMTADEFWEFCHLPENEDRRFELIDGEIIEVAASSDENTVVAMIIGSHFVQFVYPNKLGYVSGADGGYAMSTGNVPQPDVAFISKERHPQLRGKFFPIAPDLAVEVVSDSESAPRLRRKVMLYLTSGTQLVWAVYPEEKTVDVHRLSADGKLLTETLGMGDTLDGGAVLPGFRLDIRQIFPD